MKQAGSNLKGRALRSLFLLLSVILILLPAIIVGFSLFIPGGEDWEHIKSVLLPRYTFNTLFLVVGVVLLASIIGTGAAYMVSRYDFPLRKILSLLLIMPLAVPGYVAAIVYSSIFDFTGPIQSFIRGVFGINPGTWKIFDIMSLPGAIFIIAITLFPYVYVPVKGAFLSYGLGYIEPALSLGKKKVFFSILVPSVLPSILGGASLVLMETLNDFGVVNYFGVEVYQTGIFRAWFTLGQLNGAMKLSSILMIFAIIVIVIEKIVAGKKRFYGNRAARLYKREKPDKKGFILIILFCYLPLFLGFIIPVFQLLNWFAGSYSRILNKDFMIIISKTLLLALFGVFFTLIVSTFSAILSNRDLPDFVKKIGSLISVGYGIPGVIIAIGIMSISGFLEGIQSYFLFSGTLFMLLYSYNIRFMAVSYKPIRVGSLSVNTRYREASRSLGVSSWKTLFHIELPLLKKPFLVASILLFIDILKELPLTMILRPFNFETLATVVYELAGDEMIREASGPALLLIFLGVFPIYLLNKKLER